MLVQRMILDVRPLRQLLTANGANVAVLLLRVRLHRVVPVALEVADLALELDDAGVDALVSCHRCLTGEKLFTKVACIRLGEHVRHLLVLPQLTWRQEL